jgi:16S rRNA (guanine527-N7)-methyltransferase
MREVFDIVVARAVAKMNTLAELMLPFARIGGICIAYKGRTLLDELSDASYAMEVSGKAKATVLKIDEKVTGKGSQARLIVLSKGGATPNKYPRREGVPQRRPL